MPNRLRNWTANDVIQFLKSRGFLLTHTRGSHFFYERLFRGVTWRVCIPVHGSKVIKPHTVKSIIAQSGISQEEWLA